MPRVKASPAPSPSSSSSPSPLRDLVEALLRDGRLRLHVTRDGVRAAACRLGASDRPDLRAAGAALAVGEALLTADNADRYLRGTRALAGEVCTCADSAAPDRTCPQYGAPDHAAVVARRWVDEKMKERPR